MLHRLHAGVLLALSLVKTLFVRYLLPRPKDALAAFHEKFSRDRLLPLSSTQRQLLPSLSGCIGCGRCNAESGAPPHGRPMAFVLAGLRSMPEYDAAAQQVAALTDEQLDDLQARCPAQIPFREAVYFVREHASQLENNERASVPRQLPAGS